MGVVNLARVDERLIHGQVMVTLSQKSGVNSIFVVDEVVAKDKFMRDLYKNAGSRTGQKTIVITPEKAKFYWDEYQFKEYNCIDRKNSPNDLRLSKTRNPHGRIEYRRDCSKKS